MHYNNALKQAVKINQGLRSDGDIFRGTSCVIHKEGTILLYQHSGVVLLNHNYFAVFTEHHGHHVYHEDDAKWIQYKRVHEPIMDCRGK